MRRDEGHAGEAIGGQKRFADIDDRHREAELPGPSRERFRVLTRAEDHEAGGRLAELEEDFARAEAFGPCMRVGLAQPLQPA